MALKALFKSLQFTLIFCLLQGCVMTSCYQTGRTLKPNELNIGVGTGYFRSEDINDNPFTNEYLLGEYFFRIGIQEALDVGLKLDCSANVLVDMKVRLYQPADSMFAVAAGLGYGTNLLYMLLGGDIDEVQYVKIPTYFSYHPSSKFSIYFSPQYYYRPASYFEDFIVFNFGVIYGGHFVKVGVNLNTASMGVHYYYPFDNCNITGGLIFTSPWDKNR